VARHELAPRAFVAGRWQAVPAAAPAPAVDLRLVTWNVWFGGHMFDDRAAALLADLEQRRPDVIALQEVTPALLATIVQTPWLRAGYQLSDSDGQTLRRYGVLLLSRLPMRRLSLHELPSRMDRLLLVAELACGLTVATIHLESTAGCAYERSVQLGIIQPAIAADSDDAVLVGDMNFAPGDRRETAVLDPSFVDAWPVVHRDAPGYSIDTDVNTMRHELKGEADHRRIDRAFVRSRRWRPRAIELIGTDAIDGLGTFVSDHFGLEVELAVVDPDRT
jgi:endonuclease/exonuclease/phosphatase family metal-dependent hydrolase